MGRTRIAQALLMAAGLMACSVSEHAPPVASVACSVYDAFYEHIEESDGVFFRSMSLPLPPIAGGQFDSDAEWATQFQHLEGRRESVLQSLRDDFSVDATTFFDDLGSPPTTVAACFGDGSPPIHDGTLRQAQVRQTLRSFGRHPGVTLVTVSPVAISADGRHAIIYATIECGGLCGGGTFYVFERQGDAWAEIGTLGIWVS